MNGFDIIGDIHGHADELYRLLRLLGYERRQGAHRHPDGRQIIFLGDYIDRGPQIREVLEIVRNMVEAGNARAILGNHELNALRYHGRAEYGRPLRIHTERNTAQHRATLKQFDGGRLLAPWLEWFADLPLSLDLPGIRAVHACWDEESLAAARALGPLRGEVLTECSRRDRPIFRQLERILCGPEGRLPDGFRHRTADGTMRGEFRLKWWEPLEGMTCREAVFPEDPKLPAVPPKSVPSVAPYPKDAVPVFFGHYALKSESPSPQSPNVACLDYGAGKNGFLCAYRWDGERTLDPAKYVAGRVATPRR